ncbi:thioesterase [Catellatospora sp. TT07R-123]|uniref:acyl-CoA thioesterase n=1 Tax=Catellatospora sp. TT07R-123 TaxID=2733863 RepID=UPI001B1D6FAF|nr:thioesterase family protein [Catellatospora sp. TT07R-123]GHJ45507.1 thioesterase [Catellatospora sp. TT07R-123]
MRFTYHCALRWSDLDAYGHVNNARFLTLYEEARVAMMFVGARDAGVTSFEEGIVVARHEVDYLRPVDYGDPVRIELWVDDLKASRFTICYELFDGDLLASRARTVLVPYDLERRRPRRLTESEQSFLKPWLVS